jgi:hypothetical protein
MYKKFLGFLIAALAIFGLPTAVLSQETFKITPADYNIKLTTLKPVELEYRLVNGLNSTVKFSVYVSAADAQRLKDYQLDLKFSADGKENVISDQAFDYSVAASSTSLVTLKLEPKSDKYDYEFDLPVVLKQTGGDKNLGKSEYSLNLKLNSTLDTLRKGQQFDILIVGGIAALIIVAIAGLLVINRRSNTED